MHTINCNHFAATVNPLGAELSSFRINDSELMWQGDEAIWSGRAPILFPIVGSLKSGEMTYRGRRYQMPRHGIARRHVFELIDHSPSELTMRLQANPETLAVYPWQFEFQVRFTLSDCGVEIHYQVSNHDKSEMLFTLGSHPAFALDINDTCGLSDYQVVFDQTESFDLFNLDDEGLLATTATKLQAPGNSIQLSKELFSNDALVLRDIRSRTISLQRKNQTILSVDTGGAPHLGLWAKPGAPFVCIEPWLGTSDFVDATGDFETKPDQVTLAPGDQFTQTLAVNPVR